MTKQDMKPYIYEYRQSEQTHDDLVKLLIAIHNQTLKDAANTAKIEVYANSTVKWQPVKVRDYRVDKSSILKLKINP